MRRDVVLVGDDEHRAAGGVELVEQGEHVCGAPGVQRAGGLVGEQQHRFADDRPGQGHALLLAAGELVRQVVDAIGEPDPVQGGERAPPAFPRLHPGVGERQLDVGQRRRARDQLERLEDEPDLAVAHHRQLVLVEAAGVHPVEQVATAGGGVEAADDVHQRGLAAATGTHHRDVVTPLHDEVHPATARTSASPAP